MKTKLTIAALSFLLIVSSCGKKSSTTNAGPSDEVQLQLNLEKGKKYDMTMTMNSDVEMTMMGQVVNSKTEMVMGMDYEVKDVLPNGHYLMRSTYKRVKMGGSAMGMNYEFDSETGKASGMQGEEMAKSMKKIIGEYMEMEMDKTGKVISTTQSEGLKGEGSKDMTNFGYSVFPDKKIKPGDTWNSDVEQNLGGIIAMIKTKFTLVSVKDGLAEISMEGTLGIKEGTEGKISGTQTGTSKVDVATGMNKEVTIDQDITMEMAKMGMNMPMKLKNKIVIITK